MDWNFLSVFIAAFLLQVVLLFCVLKLFPRFQLMDRPDQYGHDRRPIPYSAGIVLFLGFFVATIWFVPITSTLAIILGALFVLVLVSFIDDIRDLPAWFRLIVQIFVAALVVFSGTTIAYLSNPLGGTIDLTQYTLYGVQVISIAGTIFWIVFLTNMLNWLDGVPGLVSGVSTIAFAVIFLLAARPDHVVDQTVVMYLSAILCGVSLACWLFDFHPPKLLMGDSGTMFFGAMIAILAIISGSKLATAFLVLGIAVVDGLWIIVRRLLEKRSPLKGDLDHFHHRLLAIGFSHKRVLFLYYLGAAAFGAIALWVKGIPKLTAIVVIIFLILALQALVVRHRNHTQN